MWHNVGLTLLVFVATLLIVLLLMVCGEWGIRRGAVARGGTHASSTRVAADWACFVWLKGMDGQVSSNHFTAYLSTYLSGVSPEETYPGLMTGPLACWRGEEQDPGLGILTRG